MGAVEEMVRAPMPTKESTMPTYQYRCTECGHDLEAVQKFTDASLTACPNCGGQLRKIFNAVGVVFKGTGFYRNDSRGANKSDSDSGSSEKSSTKTESGNQEPVAAAPAKSESKPSSETKATPAKSDSGSSSSTSSTASSTGSKTPSS